ncbi:MAG: hypothetical protein A3H28_07345 [Acidobacteria bacterium RIFCSPLOWO2_02_FULL_61_28]|nr:MAG: hypothetical protein A3H28_07345 [Acidobacteria bacterium RIFCSPLOWO2_02_FULL_61_28]
MRIYYDKESDLLYLRFDERKQELINRRVSEDVVLDLGAGDRIVGIEILDASRRLDLAHLMPVTYELAGPR